MQWNYNHKITGLIQNVFDGDKTTKQKIVGKKLIYFPREGGVGGGTPPWKIIYIYIFFEPFPLDKSGNVVGLEY